MFFSHLSHERYGHDYQIFLDIIGLIDGITITGNVYCSQVDDFIDLKLIFANFCHILRFLLPLFTKLPIADFLCWCNISLVISDL